MTDSTPLNLVLEGDEPWVINQRIFYILNTYLQPNARLSPVNAAQEIDKLFPLNRPREEDKENEDPAIFLFEMWDVVVSLAEQIPWNHPGQNRLVELIQALRDLPEPKTVELKNWDDQVVYSDLPLLGPVMTERNHGMRFIFSYILFCVWSFIGIVIAFNLEYPSGDPEALRIRKYNFVAFSARLTQSGVADRSLHFSIVDFQSALEVEPDYRSKVYHKQGPQMDLYVPFPVIWLLLCGDVIFSHCRNPGPPSTLIQVKDRKRNWKGASGFSIERWNFWKKRFGEIKGHDQASKKTKELATEGETLMNRIESEASAMRIF